MVAKRKKERKKEEKWKEWALGINESKNERNEGIDK